MLCMPLCVEALLETVQSILLESSSGNRHLLQSELFSRVSCRNLCRCTGMSDGSTGDIAYTDYVGDAVSSDGPYHSLDGFAGRGGVALLVSMSCVLWLRFGKAAIAYVLAVVLFLAIVPNPLQQRVLSDTSTIPIRTLVWQYGRVSCLEPGTIRWGLGWGCINILRNNTL